MISSVAFRKMNEEDLDQIMEIEKKSFATPWTYDAFYNELYSNQFANYIIAEVDETIIGYCGLWVIIDEGHITNIAILPDYRGKGLGEKLLRAVMETAKGLGAETLTLEVRVSNDVAKGLYRKLGFQDGGIRKSYYTDNYEDALVMWVNLK
ncbi:ribosomal protein S18-alanine N-acetyltransferase [Bacillus sp. AFS041924]|uniref:ribosomal protein S18-alanine N-acetyltransferase n=1 Tax=Bacillus sp. AFS041924 TaxID=2033503 RepID=UPI000BFD409E|nr:ribosomal protein S18-alanine N-acetyltransferase [Bacillus sp. AFS041924]PGS50510.1 ribosomal-protein-alanine N-acetyltransferase [Bacillus sp. AFS041924]